jgi:hypothetical protein
MPYPKKYQSTEEAKTAQKEKIRKSNESFKAKEKLFTKLAHPAQKHLIKSLKSILMTPEHAKEIEDLVLKNESIKQLTQEGDTTTSSNDEDMKGGTMITLKDDGVIDIVSVGAKKLKEKAKPKQRKQDTLLEDIENLFQKYLIPPVEEEPLIFGLEIDEV